MKQKVLLVGAGGHCKSIIDSLNQADEYDILGIIDQENNIGKYVSEIEIIGSDDDLLSFYEKGCQNCFVCIGSIGNYSLRKKLIEMCVSIGFSFINVIDPSAIVAKDVKLGKGIFIGKQCVVNAGTTINDYSIVNTGSIVEHDCLIDKFVHIAPSAVLAGNCNIGKGTHIGMNSTVLQNITIEENCMIGAGSLVLVNINKNRKKVGVIKEGS